MGALFLVNNGFPFFESARAVCSEASTLGAVPVYPRRESQRFK